MNIVKKIFLGVGLLLLLLVATAIIIPVFFKDKIMAVVKTQLNEQLNATSDFKDVDLSIFRSFPRLSVRIEGLSIVGIGDFKGDTLVAAKNIDVAVDLMKAINGDYDILNIGVDNGRIKAIVLQDGRANWDIAKPSADDGKPEAESAPFALKLRQYAITETNIEYDDRQGKMHVIIKNLNHKGSGDFSSDAFTLKTNTTADAISFINAGVPFLNKVKTAIDLDLDIDNKASKYTFNTDKIQLNGLKLYTKGYVQLPDTSNMLMDIQFGTPSNDFKDILSLVPGIYTADFKDVKTTGKLALSGFVKGKYNATQLPAYLLNLTINDGSFQYPALPQKVSNIQVKLKVSNPDGVLDNTVVNLEQGHIEFGQEPFDLRLLLRQPMTAQWVDAAAKGHIDLNRITQFVALEPGTKLAGDVKANVTFKGSMAQAQNKQYDQIDAAGTVDINNFAYSSKDYPEGVSINSLLLTFNPKNVTVANLRGAYMGTNFSGAGSVDNMLGYYLANQTLTGSLSIVADKVDVNKLMGTSATTDTASAAASTEPFVVPNNLDLELKTTIGSLKYDDIVINNMSGGVALRNEAAILKELSGKTLDGSFRMSGTYSTKVSKRQPDIAFDYTVAAVDVQKTFAAFPTIQKMMPIGKYVTGKVNSNLTMTGKLNGDMTPDLNTLSGKGDMMFVTGTLSNFPVSDELVEKLKLQQFKVINLKDMKLFYTFKDGRVIVDPYKMKIGADVEAEVAGSHGFDQTLKYGANVAVPRAALGTAANTVVNNLVGQAASRGVPITLGEKVNFTVNITGTVTKPKVETDLKNQANNALNNIKDEIKKEVQKKVDSVKTVVKDTVKAIKTQVVNEAKDELKKQLSGESDKKPEEAVKGAAEKAKEGLKGLFNKKK